MNKVDIRSQMKIKRKETSEQFINNASAIIRDKFLSEFGHFESFATYWEINSEVKTSELINLLIHLGKTVYLPIYRKDSMGFGLYNGLKEAITNKMGAKEPMNIIRLTNVDVIVVPALAFNREGFRIGYGVGFYDRVLKKIRTKHKVGFAYDFQIVDEIPIDPYDEPVDVVITEKNTYRRT